MLVSSVCGCIQLQRMAMSTSSHGNLESDKMKKFLSTVLLVIAIMCSLLFGQEATDVTVPIIKYSFLFFCQPPDNKKTVSFDVIKDIMFYMLFASCRFGNDVHTMPFPCKQKNKHDFPLLALSD